MTTASLRKVGASVMVPLPLLYLKQHGLTVRSTVEIEVKGDKLTITPGRKRLMLADILVAAPKDSRKSRSQGWDEMPAAGSDVWR